MALTRLAGAMSLWMWTLPPERHPQLPRAALGALCALYHANMLTAMCTSWAPCTRGTRGEIKEIGVEHITSRATIPRPALLGLHCYTGLGHWMERPPSGAQAPHVTSLCTCKGAERSPALPSTPYTALPVLPALPVQRSQRSQRSLRTCTLVRTHIRAHAHVQALAAVSAPTSPCAHHGTHQAAASQAAPTRARPKKTIT